MSNHRLRARASALLLLLGALALPGAHGAAVSASEARGPGTERQEQAFTGACGRPGEALRLNRADTDRAVRIRHTQCDLTGRSIIVDGQGATVPALGENVLQVTHFADGTDRSLMVRTEASSEDVVVSTGEEAEEVTTSAGSAGSSSLVCGGTANSTFSGYWHSTPNYYINAASYPRYASSSDWVTRIQNAAAVWRNGSNRCGYSNLTFRTGRNLTYAGNTSRFAGISDGNLCQGTDGSSVVSGGDLPGSGGFSSILGSNCRYGSDINTSIFESDIKIDGYNVPWIAPGTACSGSQWDLYSVVVHEFGHFLGMAHVSESTHPTLVMSPTIGACESNRLLGAGDYNGVYYKYPVGT